MKVSINAAKIDFIQCVLVDYMPEDKVIEIWNEMDSTRMGTNQIYHMNKIDAVLQNERPMNILHLTNHDEFDLNHKFFTFDISNPNKHMLISTFCFDLFKFFSYDDIISIKFAQIDEAAYNFWNDFENQTSFSKNPLFPLSENLATNIDGGFGCWYGCNAVFINLSLSKYKGKYSVIRLNSSQGQTLTPISQ